MPRDIRLDSKTSRFMDLLREKVSPELYAKFWYAKEYPDGMVVIYFRGFQVDKFKMNEFYYPKMKIVESLYYNFIWPLRRRVSMIKQPDSWRIARKLTKVTK